MMSGSEGDDDICQRVGVSWIHVYKMGRRGQRTHESCPTHTMRVTAAARTNKKYSEYEETLMTSLSPCSNDDAVLASFHVDWPSNGPTHHSARAQAAEPESSEYVQAVERRGRRTCV